MEWQSWLIVIIGGGGWVFLILCEGIRQKRERERKDK